MKLIEICDDVKYYKTEYGYNIVLNGSRMVFVSNKNKYSLYNIKHLLELSNSNAKILNCDVSKQRDRSKDEFCERNNIYLLRISYIDFNSGKYINILDNYFNSVKT